jgi:hypothetical protein
MGIEFGGCDQVLNKLREAEVLLSQGITLAVVWKKIGIMSLFHASVVLVLFLKIG